MIDDSKEIIDSPLLKHVSYNKIMEPFPVYEKTQGLV